jgi:signal transducing adaptor molecule
MKDKGGRPHWSAYTSSSNGAGASGSSSAIGSGSAVNRNSTASASTPMSKPSSSSGAYNAPKYQAGYAPARTPSPAAITPQAQQQHFPTQAQQQIYQPQASPSLPTASSTAASSVTMPAIVASAGIVTRVRALHTFEPTEPGELAFDKGDIIKVVDRGYKDWWRGQLKGRTGIFPVNYVVRLWLSLIPSVFI